MVCIYFKKDIAFWKPIFFTPKATIWFELQASVTCMSLERISEFWKESLNPGGYDHTYYGRALEASKWLQSFDPKFPWHGKPFGTKIVLSETFANTQSLFETGEKESFLFCLECPRHWGSLLQFTHFFISMFLPAPPSGMIVNTIL